MPTSDSAFQSEGGFFVSAKSITLNYKNMFTPLGKRVTIFIQIIMITIQEQIQLFQYTEEIK